MHSGCILKANCNDRWRCVMQKLYIIGNSHMDPVWLWNLREGRSAWLNTCRSVVRMMEKYPQLKFSRSSSACYRWIEESDPALFRQIVKLVDAGRWEIIGGWVVQSDTIITPAETLLRQAEHGQRYFREKFGQIARIAYSADAFGQNCGLPKLLNASGFDRYVWMRPSRLEKDMPEVFRWQGDDGVSCVTSFRIQESYRTLQWQTPEDLDSHIQKVLVAGHDPQTLFFGIGDHGGGIYEQELKCLLALSDKYELVFSTLGEYFDLIEKQELPVVSGEHTHHAPGCYSAVSEIKSNMSRAEKQLFKAEKILLESGMPGREKIYDAWEELLFNCFHDVYPGTSIKKVMTGEVRDICGYASKIAGDILEMQLSRYGATAKSDFLTEGGVLVWNPLPLPVKGVVEFDTFPDPNRTGQWFDVLTDEKGNDIALQWCRGVSKFGPGYGWGQATAVVELPPSGMKILAYGRRGRADEGIGFARQKELLEKISFPVLDDPYDTWAHRATSLGETVGLAELQKVIEYENGPVASCLRAVYRHDGSVFRADIWAYKDIDELKIVVHGRWLAEEQDLKLQLSAAVSDGKVISGQAGAVIEREADMCEQPFIDWCAVAGQGGYSGFLSASLHSYDNAGSAEKLRITLLRPVYYAEHVPHKASGEEGMADWGDFRCELWFASGKTEEIYREMPRRARERLWSVEHFEVTQAADGSGFQRDIWQIEPAEVVVTAQYINSDNKREFHLINPQNSAVSAEICKNGETLWQDVLQPQELRVIKL